MDKKKAGCVSENEIMVENNSSTIPEQFPKSDDDSLFQPVRVKKKIKKCVKKQPELSLLSQQKKVKSQKQFSVTCDESTQHTGHINDDMERRPSNSNRAIIISSSDKRKYHKTTPVLRSSIMPTPTTNSDNNEGDQMVSSTEQQQQTIVPVFLKEPTFLSIDDIDQEFERSKTVRRHYNNILHGEKRALKKQFNSPLAMPASKKAKKMLNDHKKSNKKSAANLPKISTSSLQQPQQNQDDTAEELESVPFQDISITDKENQESDKINENQKTNAKTPDIVNPSSTHDDDFDNINNNTTTAISIEAAANANGDDDDNGHPQHESTSASHCVNVDYQNETSITSDDHDHLTVEERKILTSKSKSSLVVVDNCVDDEDTGSIVFGYSKDRSSFDDDAIVQSSNISERNREIIDCSSISLNDEDSLESTNEHHNDENAASYNSDMQNRSMLKNLKNISPRKPSYSPYKYPAFLHLINCPLIRFPLKNPFFDPIMKANLKKGKDLMKGEFHDISQKIVTANDEFIKKGFYKFNLTDYQPPKNSNRLYKLKHGDMFKEFEILFGLYEIFKMNNDIYYVQTHAYNEAVEIFPDLKSWTIQEITEMYNRLFHSKSGDNVAIFYTIIHSLKKDISRERRGFLLPFISIYDNVSINDDEDNTGQPNMDMESLPNPIRKIYPNRGGHFQSKPGLTFPTSHFDFPGTPSPSKMGKGIGFNSLHLLSFGKDKNFIIIPPRYYERLHFLVSKELESLMDITDAERESECLFQHDNILIAPSFYKRHDIPFSIVNQKEGELLILASKAIHTSISNGFNVSHTMAIILSDFHQTMNYGQCQCECDFTENTNYDSVQPCIYPVPENTAKQIRENILYSKCYWPIYGKTTHEREATIESLETITGFGGILHAETPAQKQRRAIASKTTTNKGRQIEDSQQHQQPDNNDNEPHDDRTQSTCNKVIKNKNYRNKPKRQVVDEDDLETLWKLSEVLLGDPDVDETLISNRATIKKTFPCKNCKRFFSTQQQLEDHTNKQQCGKFVICEFSDCDFVTDSQDKFTAHQRTHFSRAKRIELKRIYNLPENVQKRKEEKIKRKRKN